MSEAVGRTDAPLLVAMICEPSEGMLSWFWKVVSEKCQILKSDIRLVFLLNEPPKGSGAKPTKEQLRESMARFNLEVKNSTPKVIMPMGRLPLYYITGINEEIAEARGYVLDKSFFRTIEWETYEQIGEYKSGNKARGVKKGDPKYKWVNQSYPALMEDFKGVVIPSFDLSQIQAGFTLTPAFMEDVRRVKRALNKDLWLIDDDFIYYRDFTHISKKEEDRISVGLYLNKVRWKDDVIAIDIETEGFDNQVINRVSISDGHTSASIAWNLNAINLLNDIFSRSNLLFAFHNSPFDIPRLISNGVEISERTLRTQIFDTMFGAVTLQPDLLKGLGTVSSLYLDCRPWKWKSLSTTSPIYYSAKDAFITAWLARQEIRLMKSLDLWNMFMGLEGFPGPGIMATIPELTDMAVKGLRTNKVYANWWTPILERHQLRLEKLWSKSFPGINPHSPKQLQTLLYKTWGLPVQRSREGGISTDELSLIRLRTYLSLAPKGDENKWREDKRCNERFFDLLLRLRDVSKTLSTYVQPVSKNEFTWVHPQYMPISKDSESGKVGNKVKNIETFSKGNTSTGRLATSRPNIANQPKKVRILYVPDNDDMCFIQGDWKAAELYVMASCAGDKVLLNDLQSGDLHQRNANRFGITRDVSKNVAYARQYLAGPPKVSDMILAQEHLYVPVEECKRIMDGMAELYHITEAYKRHLVEMAETKHYIRNAFGRIRYFHSSSGPAAVNFIPQSTVGDMLWCILYPVAEMARSLGGRLTTTVYDSILIQVPKRQKEEASKRLKEIMETKFNIIAPGFFIPCELELGEAGASWGELK